jgi:hypothetical protein
MSRQSAGSGKRPKVELMSLFACEQLNPNMPELLLAQTNQVEQETRELALAGMSICGGCVVARP